jgi:PPK2 family polyphosphate:nucleotide phosphotransferase
MKKFIYDPKIDLSEYNKIYREVSKEDLKKTCQKHTETLAKLQGILYADNTYSVLIVLQGLDTSGKDGIIKHVMSGVNPQGCDVKSFKKPTDKELDHDFLWRCINSLPKRGYIGIFNRSYYEDVLVAKVHPEIVTEYSKLPNSNFTLAPGNRIVDESFWKNRYESINNFEKHLTSNGTIVLKFYLQISKDTQKERLLERINNEQKHWKLSVNDLKERAYWDKYMEAFDECFKNTSTEIAPWYIIPSNHKWRARLAVSEIILEKLQSLNLTYPFVSKEKKEEIMKEKETLENEK